jgi:hypothetical protein
VVIGVVGEKKSGIKFWDLDLNTLLGVFAADNSFIIVFEEDFTSGNSASGITGFLGGHTEGFRWT